MNITKSKYVYMKTEVSDLELMAVALQKAVIFADFWML